MDLKDSMYIREELEKHNILVREDTLYGSRSVPEIVAAIPEKSTPQSGKALHAYTFVELANHQVQEKPINLQALTKEAISHLKTYHKQMGITLDQKKMLNQAITKLEQGKLGINEIRETLDDLQRKMGSKISIQFRSQFFIPAPAEHLSSPPHTSFKPKV